MAQQKAGKSESPVAARDQLNEQQDPGPDPKVREQEARAQERQQRQELAEGKASGAQAKAGKALTKMAQEAPAGARAGVHANAPTRGGFMDQVSRRSGADALEGHYVTIDLNDSDVKAEYDRLFGEDRTNAQGERLFPDGWRGDFGVYIQPLLRNPDTGIPETIQVRLRDDTHALVTVPYEAVRPAGPRGRS